MRASRVRRQSSAADPVARQSDYPGLAKGAGVTFKVGKTSHNTRVSPRIVFDNRRRHL